MLLALGALPATIATILPSPPRKSDASWQAQAGFILSVPAGWEITQEVPSWGIVLQPPGTDSPRVEFVTWLVSVGVVGPEAAAAEHERLLKARAHYRRTNVSPLSSQNAGEGVLVTGLVTNPDGGDVGSVFAAFQRGDRGYVIGLLTAPSHLAVSVANYLQPVIDGLKFTQTQPAVDLAPSPAPRSEREPAHPDLGAHPPRHGSTGGQGLGLKPESTSGSVHPAGIRLRHPCGLSVAVPAEWEHSFCGTAIWLCPTQGTSIFVLPVWGRGQPSWVNVADTAVPCLQAVPNFKLRTCEKTEQSTGTIWGQFAAERDSGPLEGRLCLVAGNGVGVLLGVVAPAGQLRYLSGLAAEIFASLEGEIPVPEVESSVTHEEWRDPSGGLLCEHQSGWHLEGGVSAYDNAPVISLIGKTTEGSEAWFAWHQPVRPVFRELTDAMRRLGFRDGDEYYAYDGIDPRMVLKRAMNGPTLIDLLLPVGTLRARRLTSSRPVAAVGMLARADEKTELLEFSEDRGPADGCAWVLVSHAGVGDRAESGFWEAASLAFGGVPGRCWEAAEAMMLTMRSASVPSDAAVHSQGALHELLERSKGALESPVWRELVGSGRWLPVLPEIRGRLRRERCTVPHSVIESWRSLASAG